MRKGARLIIGRYSGGVVFNALTPALSPNGEGTKGKPPSRTGDKYEDEEVSGTGLGRKLGFV